MPPVKVSQRRRLLRATVHDVAARAGVSLTTVHRALNGNGYVHKATLQKVLDAANAVNYRPNAVAQSLRRQRTGMLGHLVHTIYPNPFFACVARGVEDRARDLGFATVTCNTHGSVEAEADYVELLLRQRSDGIIFTSPRSLENVRHVQQNGVPVCVIERPKDLQNVDVVLADNRTGANAAVRHLLDLGHRRIAYIGGPPKDIVEIERLDGYCQALAAAGVARDESLILFPGVQSADGYRAMSRVLQLPRRPTAAFVASDMAAMGALQALAKHNLKAPNDMALVGFDDTLGAVASPPLTTVALPMWEMGAAAVDLVIRRAGADAGAPAQRIVLETRLVLRESTGGAMPTL
jgi:LacI family transcriptional regulator